MVYKLPNYNRYLIGIKPKVGEPVTLAFATNSSLKNTNRRQQISIYCDNSIKNINFRDIGRFVISKDCIILNCG